MKISLLPVYSELANDVPAEIKSVSTNDLHLSRHQLDTYQALLDPSYDVVLNTAITGDGKSLGAYLPILVNPRFHAFAMYPTNELLRDQGKQLDGYLKLFQRDQNDVPFTSLWGAELSRLQDQLKIRTRDALLKERFGNYKIILTNPDIFNLIMNFGYGSNTTMFTKEELPYTLGMRFDYFVFDEFHIFSMPQIVAVLTSMLYFAQQTALGHKFLFSTATPSEEMIKMIERSGLQYRFIRGNYRSEPDSNYRQVLYASVLNLHKLDDKSSAEKWVEEHIKNIVDFWRTCDNQAKGAIIVNSVASARRIVRMLEQELPPDITVGENTGLTDDARRHDSLRKHIVVGTSTIDVGVDFNINFLIFESINAGTFLQRLGRLGRVKHDVNPFPKYEAHALLSGRTPWIYSRLEESIKDGEEVERAEQFRDIVQNAFPQENQFESYIKRWGILQPVHVVQTLKLNKEKTYHDFADRLKERYQQVFDANFDKAKNKYYGILKNEEKGSKVIDEVLTFRGSSPFQVASWDDTVQPPAFIEYDLFSLVQSADYITVTKDEYLKAVESYADGGQKTAALDALKHTLGHTSESPLILKICEFFEEREQLLLWVGKDLSQHKDRIQILKGLRIQEPHTCPFKSEINAVLSQQKVVCYCTKEEPRNLRRNLRLPAMFPLFRIRDKYDKEYTIAFGKTALLLDSVMLRYKNKNLDDPIII